MTRTFALIPLLALLVVLPGPVQTAPSGAAASVALPVTVESPNSQIKFDLSLRSENRAAYRVTLKGRPVVELSRLGILVDGVNLGDGATVAGLERTRHDDRYRTRGVHSTAIDRYNAATIALIHQPSGIRYSIDIRVFDDGVAFRYVVPAAGNATRVPDEATGFNFPPRSVSGTTTSMGTTKAFTRRRTSRTCRREIGRRLRSRRNCLTDLGYASITEAGLKDYAGMVLQTDRRGGLAARLAHAAPASYPYRLRYPALDVRRLEIPASISGHHHDSLACDSRRS